MIVRYEGIPYLKVKRPGYVTKVAQQFRVLPLEKEVESNLTRSLIEYGFRDTKNQVKCAGGKIDIVAGILCIEVKRELTNSTIKGAFGQVLIYAQQLNKQPSLAGYPGNCDDTLIKQVRDQGCHLMLRVDAQWLWYPPVIK